MDVIFEGSRHCHLVAEQDAARRGARRGWVAVGLTNQPAFYSGHIHG